MRNYLITLFTFLLCCSSSIFAQEICNNAIDDDLDGLIDYNDEDCNCVNIVTDTIESFIPNPSFEDYTCLPTTFSEMTCADTWIQASPASSDYLHTQSFTGENYGQQIIPFPPLPPPDGEGFVGFAYSNLDLYGYGYDNVYIEYIGACLTEQLNIGENYTLQLNVGFGLESFTYFYFVVGVPDSFELCIYGANDCSSLPFGGYSFNGCPTNDGTNEWDLLNCITVSGENEWVTADLSFLSNEDYESIVIGPSCDVAASDTVFYMFLDGLTLNESSAFNAPDISIENDCLDYTLSVPNVDGFDVQWFSNFEAIVGATDTFYQVTNDQSDPSEFISVVFDNGMDCSITDSVYLQVLQPLSYNITGNDTICLGEDAIFNITGDFDSVLWNGTTSGSSFDTDQTGPITLEISNDSGCEFDTIINVIASTEAAIYDVLLNGSLCNNGEISIEVLGNYEEIYWNNQLGGSIETFTNAGDIDIILISENLCENDTTISIAAIDDVVLNAINGSNQICEGDSTLIAIDGLFDEIYWNGQLGTTQQYFSEAGLIDIQLNSNDCQIDTSVFISNLANASGSIIGESAFCVGDSTLIEIEGSFAQIIWNGEVGTNQQFFSEASEVSIELITDSGCAVDTIISLSEYPELDVEILNGDLIILEETNQQQVSLSSTSENVNYTWTPTTGLSCTNCAEPIVTAFQDVTYIVEAIDNETGCSAVDSISIIVEPLPEPEVCEPYFANVFTPNDDAINDRFNIQAIGECDITISFFAIYNRWGELVYKQTNVPFNQPEKGWDGTFNGRKLNPGVFVYVAEIVDQAESTKVYKGNVTLIR